MIGRKFNRLTVLKREHVDRSGTVHYLCKCICGTEKIINGSSVRCGAVQSCGCLQRERAAISCAKIGKNSPAHLLRHGKSGSKIHNTWLNMRRRCESPYATQYKDYGGRGITVCKRWKSFEKFYEDMGDPPSEKHTLDRINNSKGYSKSNCRWSTRAEQNLNHRRNHWITYGGETLTVSQWSIKLGGACNLVSTRLCSGWSEERAVSTPYRMKLR